MANFNFNKLILGGRIVTEPELKTTANGTSVVTVTVAVAKKTAVKGQERESNFFYVTAWRNTAELLAKYFHKGSSICIVGYISNRNYTDQSGAKRYTTDIVAEEVLFVDSKQESGVANTAPQTNEPPTPNFEAVDLSNGELPF